MKSDEPERWSATHARDASSAEARYGEAFRIVAAAPLPSDEAFERVRRALHRPVRRTRPFALALIIAGIASGAAWATRGIFQRQAPSPPRALAPMTAPAPIAASEPPRAPTTPAPETRAPRPPRAQRRIVRPAAPEITEAALLGQVFRHLRIERDGRAALTRLAEYDRRFPTGHLRPEAAVARAEAVRLLREKR